MKKCLFLFLIVLFNVSSAMERPNDLQPRDTVEEMNIQESATTIFYPDIIQLIAYALVDAETPDKVLSSLRNFSTTNKAIHACLYKLRCGDDKKSKDFNAHVIGHIEKKLGGNFSSHIMALAYVGTPLALKALQRYYFIYQRSQDNLFQQLLGAQYNIVITETVECYDGLSNTSFVYSLRAPSSRAIAEKNIEPLADTLKKFPPATRDFVMKLCNSSSLENEVRLHANKIIFI